ncbi:hypothetical protein BSLG_009097 [Batrachochytrium salamandrivorans]|nr:hypothetical protein BSLG_009097 [Batrachochytrium salamandrivorans]
MASPSREDLLKDMSPKDQEALAKFLYAEQQKSMFYKQAGEYTDLCWDKCITKIRPQLDKADLGEPPLTWSS